LYDPFVSAEYVDDLPYVRHFIADLSPVRLRLVAALSGLMPPPDTDFDYCELGCAHGDTLAALAAAYPESRFLGVDLSAAHVASAKRLARDGALENIGVLERDFADLIDEDIGEFDYIAAHGVLSWVSPEKRKALLDFAKAKLKPGGLLHVSYNAMPGWASVEPLRQLLLFGGANAAASGTSLERARLGLEFAQSMERAGAEYFAKNPAASEMLETMAKAGLPYVVHEYLHEHWTPMYFARVAWEMAASDLHFVGGLPVHSNFRDTAISEEQERLLAHVKDRATFESLKDFATDEFFRRDVFVKGTPSRSAAATNLYLDTTTWGTLSNELPADKTVRLPHRTVSLEGPTFAALFAALAASPSTLPALAARAEHAGLGLDALRAALLRLGVAEQVIPMREPGRPYVSGADDLHRVPSVYNQTMLRRLSTDAPIVMVSSVAGTAFPMSALEGLAIRMITEVAAPDREKWVEELVGRSVLRIRVGDRVLEDRADQRRAILDTVEQLRARLPKFIELGILAEGRA
jgi:SAM-dependent methyltransferase